VNYLTELQVCVTTRLQIRIYAKVCSAYKDTMA